MHYDTHYCCHNYSKYSHTVQPYHMMSYVMSQECVVVCGYIAINFQVLTCTMYNIHRLVGDLKVSIYQLIEALWFLCENV